MQNKKKNNKTTLWVAIGAIILIIILLFWQGMALFTGDTDVAAFLTPTAAQLL